MDSQNITEKIMKKLDSLGYLDSMNEDVQSNVSIIIEEMIDINFEKIRPRTSFISPTIQLYGDNHIKVKGASTKGRRSIFKFHLMEIGDTLVVETQNEMNAHRAMSYFIETYKPEWKFKKERDAYEVRFIRIK